MISAVSRTSVSQLSTNPSWSLFIDIANTLKAFIGLNVMVVAYAFSNAGIVRGIVGLIVIAATTEHCCHLLIETKNSQYQYLSTDSDSNENNFLTPDVTVDGIGSQTASTTETDVQQAPTYGDIAFRVGGKRAENIINLALILTQFGYCVGYLIFISQTFHDVLASAAPVSLFVLAPLPVVSVLALLTSIRSLGPFSVFANGALLCGCGAVVAFIAKHFNWTPARVSITSLPLFFGQMTASLEGIGLVIPLQTSMENKKDFSFVLRVALGLLTCLLMTIGILGFATFGADTRSIILLNFGHSPIVLVVKSVLIIGILFTYPLQIIPVFEFAERKFLSSRTTELSHVDASSVSHTPEQFGSEFQVADEDDEVWDSSESRNDGTDRMDMSNNNYVSDFEGLRENGLFVNDRRIIAVRLGIIAFTALIAVFAGASFGVFQALVGSAGASVLAYTAPALLHNMAFKDQLKPITKAKNFAIAMFGILGAIVGTVSSIWEILQIHRGNSSPT